ncbi:MAG TPA: hypothetical protein VIM99_12345 [Blastocatellia bacterium]
MSVRSKKHILLFVLWASLVSASTLVPQPSGAPALISSAMALPQSTERWRQVADLKGAFIKAFFSHGDYLFAGGFNGVFRSTDQGQSWKRINSPGAKVATNSLSERTTASLS